ncbi:hypothetical protein MKW92_050922 [Papaver armeniacum]|nr:hypothetical protein MKW92_050922 [Papaver armeniacum]
MPATAGRVRMPANNRVHSSAALQTHGIWQSAIGYDPYAPNKDEPKQSSSSQPMSTATAAEPDAENAYTSFQELLALARITGSNADNETRGSCRKCGRVGHLYFQCRNLLSLKEEKEKDAAILQVGLGSGLDKFKVNGAKELSEESESSDSDFDSEMEREIAARYGRKGVSKSKTRSLSKRKDDDSDEDEEEERKKRGRSKKRTSRRRSSDTDDDDDEGGKKRRKEKKSRHDDSSDEDDKRRNRHRKSRKEKRRRRSHHDSDDSDSSEESKRRHKRRHRKKTSSGSDVSDSDDSRVGRAKEQSRKISKHRRHEVVAA